MSDARGEDDPQSTNWSAILSAPGEARNVEKLLSTYWGPIYAYIRSSGASRDDAAELTQEFIAQAVLSRDLFGSVDPERGRFRTFLKASVRNFLVDQHRRATAQKRAGERPTLGSEALAQFEPVEETDPSAAFERRWAATLLSQALVRLEADCLACGQDRHWRAFQMVIVEPILGRGASSAPALERVAELIGAESPEQVSSLIQTTRRKFQRILLSVVSSTVDDPADAAAELARVKEVLGQ